MSTTIATTSVAMLASPLAVTALIPRCRIG
jgi:hypothetical protein